MIFTIRRRSCLWGALVFHAAARWRDDHPGGEHRPLWRCKERNSELIQWRFHRTQGHKHVLVEHTWNSRHVSVWGKWSQVTIEGNDHSAQSSIQTVSSSSDSGEYHCVTTPWYLSASTGAWTEGGELTSSRIFLTVRFAGEKWTAPTVVPIVCLVQTFWASYVPLLQCGNPSSYRSYTASQLL